MAIRVDSEIGRLHRVLVHRPGREIDWMVPDMMEHLLFDDILYGEEARGEHDRFCEVLRRVGVEVVEAGTLLTEVLEDEAARRDLLRELEGKYGASPPVLDLLTSLPASELAGALITGVRSPAGGSGARRALFDLPPLPNYFFQRDPQVVVGDRVIVGSMATEAREREPLLARTIFRHPHLAGYRDLFEIDRPPQAAPEHDPASIYPTLEGGDVVVASPDTLLVGVSARTNRRGAEVLAEYLRREPTRFRNLVLVEIPVRRSYMHLDTVFTVIDRGVCLAYLPVIEGGRPESARVYRVDLESRDLTFTLGSSLLETLAELGLHFEAVPCGGSWDVIEQEREQWTDGANAFALAPGVILLYRRNRRTVDELAARGWRVLEEEEVVCGGVSPLEGGPTVVSILGNELSRARGGPRCMTMPLEREAVAVR